MAESSSGEGLNAIELLKADHEKVKDLFDQFEETENAAEKKRLVDEACHELKIHSAIEEEIFYPAVRREISDEALMNEADEEHHEAKVLIAELETMDGSESHFEAKFHVLSENIRHHIEEEETEMLPKAEETELDMDALGEEMSQRKQELIKEGVPRDAEGRMVAASRGRGDSSAANARQHSGGRGAKSRTKSR